jgi:hypothetical protein
MASIRRGRRVAPDKAPNTLIASAKRFKGAPDMRGKARSGSGWQDAAWHFYNTVGEYAYAVNWVGNLLSRAKLFATVDVGGGPVPVPDDHPAAQLLNAFFYNEQGRSSALQQIGVHYTVPGDVFIVGTQDEDGADLWEVVACGRISAANGRWMVDGRTLPGTPFVMQIRRQHPANAKEATSPSRAALPILSEIERLTMHVAAQVDSRLASAGILFLPNEMTFSVTNEDGGSVNGTAERFARELQEVLSRVIENRDHPSALVPIVVTVDGEFVDKAHHLTFWSDLDNQAIELRTEAIRRLALSMDMPPEILTGQGDTNHWSAWSIDESAIKSHTEPLLNRIADDLAMGYLRPLLIDGGMDPDEARSYGIGIDTTEMRLRPNRSREALELWDRGVLDSKTLLEETGFDPLNMPGAEELRLWFQMKVASGQTTPEIVEAALAKLGVNLDVVTDPAPPADRPEQQQARPVRSLEDHPDNSPPEMEAAMIAGCEVLVFRALERAGNRMRTKMNQRVPGVAAAETYLYFQASTSTLDFVLEDAWSIVERFAPKWGVDAERLSQCLDSYTRAIITEQKPHDAGLLAQFINLVRV